MRYAYEDDTLLGLEKARKGRKPRRWGGSLPQRVWASKRVPQAVFKISSRSHSAGALWDRMQYVAREGELAVEDANGEQLTDLVGLEERVDTWAGQAAGRKGGVLALSAVVSFPAGVDQEQATEASRQFFAEAFGRNHDYVFAPHDDAKQFHVHVIVQARGHDGTQLRIRKDDIHDLRMLLAEKARAQGIELDASPRWARGVEKEPQRPRTVEGIERRGGEAAWEPAEPQDTPSPARTAAMDALAAERAKHPEADPTACQALEYGRAAAALTAAIPKLESDTQKAIAAEGAVQLAEFGWQLTARPRGTDTAADIHEAQAVINRAARAIHDHIQGIEAGADKRAAIQAERRLTGQLQAYRQEQREQAAAQRKEREAAEEREAGPELEP